MYLLAAMTGDGRTVSQLPVPDKANETTCSTALPAPFGLRDDVVSADALHTQTAHARFPTGQKQAHFPFLARASQPVLFAALRSLPWKEVTALCYHRGAGHGRREARAARALTVTGLGPGFPRAVQAARILRCRVDTASGMCTRETAYVVTDRTSAEACPQRISLPARPQRTIENRLH
ncbi:hypothetical protein ACFWIB_42805 [Streptomyces sp. NPDC127051]|uniref:hypothetical protein n=1 Tax=Streptomyces sp. NPDC127051 TaxID=3347119 RepID=UPI00364B031C